MGGAALAGSGGSVAGPLGRPPGAEFSPGIISILTSLVLDAASDLNLYIAKRNWTKVV
jgi:hypothetical protein